MSEKNALGIKLIIFSVILLTGCVKFQRASLNPSQSYNEFISRSLESTSLKRFIEEKTGRTNINWPPQNWDVPLLSLAGLYYNPAIESARASGKVADSAIITAKARPNPTISPEVGINSSALDQSGVNPWMPAVNLSIPIETANKRGYRIAIASNKVEIEKMNLILTSWQVRSNIRSAYIELLSAYNRSNILFKQIQLQEKVRELQEKQLNMGEIKASDLMPTRILIANTHIELGNISRQLDEAYPQLASSIGVPLSALKKINLQIDLNKDTNVFTHFLSTNLIEFSLKNRPDILAAIYEFEAAQSALQLEIAKQYPDVNLNPGYQWDQGENKWTIGLSVELPIFNKNEGPIAEAMANRNLAAAKFNELQINIISEMEAAIVSAQTAIEQLKRFSILYESKMKNLNDLELQLKYGVIDTLTLEQARLELSATELPLLEAYLNLEKALAGLESAFLIPLEEVIKK